MKHTTLLLIGVALLLGSAQRAKADLTITFVQAGPNVTATGVGSLNFTDLTFSGFNTNNSYVNPSGAAVLLGVSGTYADYYGAISGPATFGLGPLTFANSSTSTAPSSTGAGVDGATGRLIVPGGYFANDPFTVSATWNNTTISALGLTPGAYAWTWGSGVNADSLEVMIPGAVPEPSALILVATMLVALAFVTRKRIAARLNG